MLVLLVLPAKNKNMAFFLSQFSGLNGFFCYFSGVMIHYLKLFAGQSMKNSYVCKWELRISYLGFQLSASAFLASH